MVNFDTFTLPSPVRRALLSELLLPCFAFWPEGEPALMPTVSEVLRWIREHGMAQAAAAGAPADDAADVMRWHLKAAFDEDQASSSDEESDMDVSESEDEGMDMDV